MQIVEDLTWYLDEPFGDTSAIPTYMVSKLAAEHVKVVLTGDGGDELFAGYDKYVVEGRERSYDRVPAAHPQDGRRGRRADAGRHDGPALPAASRARRSAALSRRLDDVPRRRDAAAVPARGARSRSRGTTRGPTSLADWREPGGDWLAAVQYATSTATCRSTS